MTPTSETVTQLLRRRAVERAFGKQLADEDFSKKGNGILITTLNDRAMGGMAYSSFVMDERTAEEIAKITGTNKEDWWKR